MKSAKGGKPLMQNIKVDKYLGGLGKDKVLEAPR